MTISSLDDQKATDKVLTLIILPETLKNLPYATGHNKSFSWSDPTTHALGSFYVFRQLYLLPYYMPFGSSKNNFFDVNDKVGHNSSEKIAIFRFPGNLILSRFCNFWPQTFWVLTGNFLK